jgi:hypothetical protein
MKALFGFTCASVLLSSLLTNILLAADTGFFTFPNGRQAGQIEKVTCQLEIGGELLHVTDGKEHREKISAIHNLVYDEKTLAVAAAPRGVSRSARYYSRAEAVNKHGDDGVKISLSADRRLVGAEISEQSAVLYSPLGTLSEDELESIDILGNSLLLDGFLPNKPVAVGEAWKHSDQLIAQFLWLDNVGQSDVQSTLKEVTDQVARFKISGKVLGIFKGTPSEIEIEGNYRYDRRRNRIDWLGMLVKEQRKSSDKTDGAQVVARTQVLIVPRESSPELSDSALKNVPFEAKPESLRLAYRAKNDDWAIAYDRCWSLYHYLADKVEMHLLEKGDVIARCSLSSLTKADPTKLVSLEGYQHELRTSLEQVKSFGDVVGAAESATSENYRVLRVEIRGTASDLPMRWIYYHVADPQGRQAIFAIVVEEKLYDRLAEKDKTLVEAFRFTETRK